MRFIRCLPLDFRTGTQAMSYVVSVRVGCGEPDRAERSGTGRRGLDYVAGVLAESDDAVALIACASDERPAPERARVRCSDHSFDGERLIGIAAADRSRARGAARGLAGDRSQAGGQPISWVALACELQRDWSRQETVADIVQIVITERLSKE
jgi:hypothetical protein